MYTVAGSDFQIRGGGGQSQKANFFLPAAVSLVEK